MKLDMMRNTTQDLRKGVTECHTTQSFQLRSDGVFYYQVRYCTSYYIVFWCVALYYHLFSIVILHALANPAHRPTLSSFPGKSANPCLFAIFSSSSFFFWGGGLRKSNFRRAQGSSYIFPPGPPHKTAYKHLGGGVGGPLYFLGVEI